jgi:hypothetical protein
MLTQSHGSHSTKKIHRNTAQNTRIGTGCAGSEQCLLLLIMEYQFWSSFLFIHDFTSKGRYLVAHERKKPHILVLPVGGAQLLAQGSDAY